MYNISLLNIKKIFHNRQRHINTKEKIKNKNIGKRKRKEKCKQTF